MSKSLAKRILLAVIALPLLYLVIVVATDYHHFLFMCVVIIASFIGSYELNKVFDDEKKPYLHYLVPSFIPLSVFMALLWEVPIIYPVTLAFIFLLLATTKALLGKDDFKNTISKFSNTLFLLFYPNFGIFFLILILFLPHSTFLILVLFCGVFANDSFAYIFGMLFGKNNKGYFKASPNKSIAGFIGGAVATVIAIVIINSSLGRTSSLISEIVFGLLLSIVANIGDLFESALKRNANIKDSGTIMLGRGGILDSIDSIIFAAPAVYLLALILGI